MDVTHEMSKFTLVEASGIRRLPHRMQRTVNAMGDYFEGLCVPTSTVFFKLLVRVRVVIVILTITTLVYQ